MAITRAQQAKQMLQNGGRIGLQGGGADMGGVADSKGNVGASFGGGSEGQFSPPDDRGKPEQNLNQKAQVRAAQVRAIENFIDRPTFGFTDAAKFNLTPLPIRVLSGIFSGGTGKVKPPLFQGGGGDSQAMATIPMWMQLGFNSEAEYLASLEQDEDKDKEPEEDEGLRLAFRADGGPIGGEYDFESARQMYGLGKLVKKVTKTVKKIAKSPIGKAALLYAGAGGLGNLAAGKGFGSFFSGFTSPSTFLGRVPGIFTKSGLQNIGARIGFGGFENIGGERVFQKNILGKALTSPTGIVAATSLAAGLLTAEEEQQAQELAASSTDFDLERARNSILAARREQYMMDERARGFKADGGRIEYQEGSKEPVAKKTMPLLDMGGKEMDLREEGGFVPIGRMEKADDVPARLSKNEFVFTADAVRNAGDGDVDKGAEVMYNMMKNLEAGGEVSEESQGLEGARKMFQTSQRLEEVL
jgi:hypothetical protein